MNIELTKVQLREALIEQMEIDSLPEVLKLVSLDSSNMPEHQKKSFELLKELALIQFRRV